MDVKSRVAEVLPATLVRCSMAAPRITRPSMLAVHPRCNCAQRNSIHWPTENDGTCWQFIEIGSGSWCHRAALPVALSSSLAHRCSRGMPAFWCVSRQALLRLSATMAAPPVSKQLATRGWTAEHRSILTVLISMVRCYPVPILPINWPYPTICTVHLLLDLSAEPRPSCP